MSEIISWDGLLALVAEWLSAGKRAVGPVSPRPGLVRFASLDDPQQLLLDGFVHPANTAKEYVFPKNEKLYGYRFEGQDAVLTDNPVEPAPTLLVGCRPCDAAAFPIVDKVMNWDVADAQYNRRREALTVVTMACREWDEHCFCTTVGLGPVDGRGSDVLLLDLHNGSYEVRVLTDRGRELMSGRTKASVQEAELPSGPPVALDLEAAQNLLRNGFDSEVWKAEGMRCLGCGSCAYTCPTCHCFDIVDESHGGSGCRMRNWDACQFRMFTMHASGHNPRPDQPSRQRQRNLHKFVIYPDKFGDYLCTGCGNCYRNCPVNLGVLNMLKAAVAQPAEMES